MASVLISGLIPVLQQPRLMPGMEEERQKLLQLFREILPAIPRAEFCEYRVEIPDEREARAAWHRDLNTATYEADNIVYEFRYVTLRAEAETDRHQSGDKVRTSIFSLCKLVSGRRLPSMEMEGMRERLTKIVIRMGDLVERSTHIISRQGQVLMPCVEGWQDPTLSSLKEIDPIIVGRYEEKEKIVRQLQDWHEEYNVPILAIVGDHGIGKSTLARLICGDAQIKNHYEIILWVDVGDEFNIGRIAKSVIDQVIGKDCCLSEGDMDLLGRRIYQELSGKRYLLVLDDFYLVTYNWEKWEHFKSWIMEEPAARGSSIITTTCDDLLFPTMFYSKYELSPLRNEDLWALLCRRAFIASNEISPEVHEISQQILEICAGSPLMVNLMGGLMKFLKEPAEWQKLKHHLMRINKDYNSGRIIELCFELCINHLSHETRECFTFCSLFPKGHYMDKEVLVKLWMANDLISSNGPTSVEEKGNLIFNELAMRHFFEDIKFVPESSSRDKHGYCSKVICKMHGIIHDYASRMNRGFEEDIHGMSSHDYLSIHGDSPVDIPELLKNYPNVRTLIYPHDPFIRTVNCHVMPKSNSLRALHLHSASFDRDLFELKYTQHLKYLDLSGSRIKRLPESISSLYFLQTLNLSKCLFLCQLPNDMRYIINLRHLYVDKCPKLKKMPVHLRKLSCLKTLTTYIVGETTGNGIDEIKCLNLGGLLEIYGMRKVKDATNAKEADLISKTNLERLSLCWGTQQLVMSKENNDSEVLEALQPHSGLKVLKIQQYGGNEFANWLTDPVGLQNLVELHLIGCSQCSTIPAVWKVRSLRVLCLKYMINLTCMFNFVSFPWIDDKNTWEISPSLKRLVLVGLKKLERWHEGEASERTMLSFPVLDEMEITNCPDLKTMPSVPMLKYLTIRIENHGLLQSAINLIKQSKSLVEVNIAKASGSDNEALSPLGAEVKECNTQKLRVMRLDSTNSFFMDRAIPHLQLGFWRSLVSLENLDILNCSSIVAWPLEEFRNLGQLKRLSVRKCPKLTGLLHRQLQEGEYILPKLQSLEFYECPSLKEVPKCSSIRYLELDECPEINSISGLINLEMLFLSCLSWTSLPTGFEDQQNLKSLRVLECYCLTSLPIEVADLTSLQIFIINQCPRVISLPEGFDKILSCFNKFQIIECPDLEKFCEEEPYSSIISHIDKRRNDLVGPSKYEDVVEMRKRTECRCESREEAFRTSHAFWLAGTGTSTSTTTVPLHLLFPCICSCRYWYKYILRGSVEICMFMHL